MHIDVDDAGRFGHCCLRIDGNARIRQLRAQFARRDAVVLNAAGALVAAGVTVTINTDDPPMVGTDLNSEYAIVARLLDLDERGMTELALTAVDASFAGPETKAAVRAEISSYAAAPAP